MKSSHLQERLFSAEESAPVPSWMRSPDAPPEMKPLRPLQVRAVAEVRQALARMTAASLPPRVMLKSPTGSGKTVIASNIIQSAVAKSRRVWFVVNAISLVDQTVTKFWQEGIRCLGVLQGDHEMTDMRQPVQVCSVQTLARRQTIYPPDLILIDEAHNWFDFYKQLWALYPNVPIIGLSATPYTKGLGRHYGELVIACSTQELIDQGLLSPFKVYAPGQKPDLADVRIVAGDYHEGDLSKAMDKPELVADVVETWLAKAGRRPTLCYAVDRAHARHLQERFTAAGVAAAYMDANTEIEERRAIGEQFARREIDVVTNVGVLTTGIDWDVRCIILDRPTRSEMLFQQIIGRGLRTAEGKDYCLILDHSDTHAKLGFVTDVDDRNLELDGGEKKPSSTKPAKQRLPSECPKCHLMRPAHARKCPMCGFAPVKPNSVEQADGELEAFDGKKEKFTKEQKLKFFGELLTYGDRKGHKPGWAAMKFKEKFGVWPNAYRAAEWKEPSAETLSWIKSRNIAWAKRRPA